MRRRVRQGATLIEVMVSLVLGLMLLGSAMALLDLAARSLRLVESLRIEDAGFGRWQVDWMADWMALEWSDHRGVLEPQAIPGEGEGLVLLTRADPRRRGPGELRRVEWRWSSDAGCLARISQPVFGPLPVEGDQAQAHSWQEQTLYDVCRGASGWVGTSAWDPDQGSLMVAAVWQRRTPGSVDEPLRLVHWVWPIGRSPPWLGVPPRPTHLPP